MLLSIPSDGYPIHFNENAYRELQAFLDAASYTRIFILADENTRRFCLPVFMSEVEGTYPVEVITMKAGETHKNINTCLRIWKRLSACGADRKSLLINLGGGVVTDLGGFVAATYMRGIDFINVPTSLLAMVDAAVGGKTGVDLGTLKNHIGLIRTPQMVMIDTSFLHTLPENQLKSGLAEMFKHGLIAGEEYWNRLAMLQGVEPERLEELIRESVIIKNNIVRRDPGEKNLRKILNYGHTLGHAIESCFLNKKEPLLHGEAVAVGIVLATYLSQAVTGFPEEKLRQIKEVVLRHFKKVEVSTADYKKIIGLLRHDKKNIGGNINFVLLKDIGEPVIDQTVSEALIEAAFSYYKK